MYFGLPQQTINKIIEVFENTKEIKKAVIFGSRARGDYGETSDIDIGLYLEGELDAGVFDNIDIVAGIYKTNILIVEEIVNKKLKANIERDAVVIYEKSITHYPKG